MTTAWRQSSRREVSTPSSGEARFSVDTAISCTAIPSRTDTSANERSCERNARDPMDHVPARRQCSMTAQEPASPSPDTSEFITTTSESAAGLVM